MNLLNYLNKNNNAEESYTNLFGMNFLIFSLMILFLTVGGGCKKDQVESGIKVNIKNISNYDYTNIILQGKEFGDLQKGEESVYLTFDKVYLDLASVKLYIDGIEFTLQPIDYDAPELTKGSCTYLINVINFENRILTLETAKEI